MEVPEDPGEYSQSLLDFSQLFFAQANLDLIGLWAIIIVLIVISALVSGSEVAFFSLTKEEKAAISLSKSRPARITTKLLQRPRYLLATILICNNLVNVGIIVVSFFALNNSFDFSHNPLLGYLINVVVITLVLVIFGEILPKVYASQARVKFSHFMASPISVLDKMFFPFSRLMVNSTRGLEKRLEGYRTSVSMEEIDKAIDLTLDGQSTEDEARMLKGIIKFGNISAKQIMKSRGDVEAIEIKATFQEVLQVVRSSGFSRIPIYEDNHDQIRGILYAKDLLGHLTEGPNFSWQSLIREPFIVPENIKIDDLLNEIRRKRIHLAIVVDEYGGTTGIVTLEDVMEEVIGEISDEYDQPEESLSFQKLSDGSYAFEGKTLINDVCRFLDLDINTFDEVKGDADSLAGLIIELSGKIPSPNEDVQFEKYLLKVINADNKRILKASLTIL